MNNTFINDSVNTILSGYKSDKNRIIQDYNKEQQNISDYHGRELLELLQNADDELDESTKCEVEICYRAGYLTISNYGHPFDEDGVRSLLYSNLSAKGKRKNVIGNKGLGFRSILNWADEVTINSKDLHIRFSEGYSQNKLNEILTSEEISSGVYKAAILVFPEIVQDNTESKYITTIRIKLKKGNEVKDSISQQIQKIDGELLLFLNRAKTIKLINENSHIVFNKYCDGDNVTVEKIVDDIQTEKQEWNVNKISKATNFEQDTYNYSIVIAYKKDGSLPNKQYIYSYFPTQVAFYYPVLLNADLQLKADRNHLVEGNKLNEVVLKDAAAFLVETAEKRAKESKISNYDALNMVIKTEHDYNEELDGYSFDKYLDENINDAKILPTVAEKYISFTDKPKYNEILSKSLSGEAFGNLLKYTDSDKIQEYLRQQSYKCIDNAFGGYQDFLEYDYDDLIGILNKWTEKLEPTHIHLMQVAMCMIAIYKTYGYGLHEAVPNISFDENGMNVKDDEKLYYPSDSLQISIIPPFAKIRCIHPLIIETIKNNLENEHEINSCLNIFGISELTFDEILDGAVQIIEEMNFRNENSSGVISESIVWAWNNKKSFSISDNNILYFPTVGGNFARSDELYFGKLYNEQISEDLFHGILDDKLVGSIFDIIGKNAPLSDVKDFLQLFNVRKYPRLIDVSLDNNEYIQSVLDHLTYPVKFDDQIIEKREEFNNNFKPQGYNVMSLDELDTILSECNTASILNWIDSDTQLQNILFNNEHTESFINILWARHMNARRIDESQVYPYILWMFQHMPWIVVGKNRYFLQQCLMQDVKEKLSPIVVQPDIESYVFSSGQAANMFRKKYEDIFRRFSVINDFDNLPLDKIYQILLRLPLVDENGKISRRVYESVILRTDNLSDFDNENRKRFLKDGFVFTNHGYKKIDESYYLDDRSVCNIIQNYHNLIIIPKRQSTSKVKDYFGVNRLKITNMLEITWNEHYINEQLNAKCKSEIFPYAYCYRMDKLSRLEDAGKLKKAKLIFCDSVKFQYDKQDFTLDDFDFITNDKQSFYIKIPQTYIEYGQVLMNMNFISTLSDILCTVFDSTDNRKDFMLICSLNNCESREKLVTEEYENENIVNEAKKLLDLSLDKREKFMEIFSKISGAKSVEIQKYVSGIDFDNINSINNGYSIIRLFRSYDVDIDDYNKNSSEEPLSVSDYYKKLLVDLENEYEPIYKTILYKELLNKSIDKKGEFISQLYGLKNIELNILNSVKYDVKKELLKKLNISNDDKPEDLSAIYKSNYDKLKNMLSDPSLLDDFLISNKTTSLLYFGEFDYLITEYKKYSLKTSNEYEGDKEEAETMVNPVLIDALIKPLSNQKINRDKAIKVGFGPGEEKKEKKKKDTGRLGEKFVYELLSGKFERVAWRSENAKAEGINPEGSSDYGYDMDYTDEKGKTIFVEVKSSSAKEMQFYMSANEFNFGTKHSSDYVIYYVFDILSAPKIIRLDDIFVDGKFNKNHYSIETDTKYCVSGSIVTQVDE